MRRRSTARKRPSLPPWKQLEPTLRARTNPHGGQAFVCMFVGLQGWGSLRGFVVGGVVLNMQRAIEITPEHTRT